MIFGTIIIVINLLTIFFFCQLLNSEVILIRSNSDATIVDILDQKENIIGVIPKDELTEVRLMKGMHDFIFYNNQQVLKRRLLIDGRPKEPIYLDFENIEVESLKLHNSDK